MYSEEKVRNNIKGSIIGTGAALGSSQCMTQASHPRDVSPIEREMDMRDNLLNECGASIDSLVESLLPILRFDPRQQPEECEKICAEPSCQFAGSLGTQNNRLYRQIQMIMRIREALCL